MRGKCLGGYLDSQCHGDATGRIRISCSIGRLDTCGFPVSLDVAIDRERNQPDRLGRSGEIITLSTAVLGHAALVGEFSTPYRTIAPLVSPRLSGCPTVAGLLV